MSYVLSDTTAPRLARFAREVFGVEEADNRKAAELGIQKAVSYTHLRMPKVRSLQLPQKFLIEVLAM